MKLKYLAIGLISATLLYSCGSKEAAPADTATADTAEEMTEATEETPDVEAETFVVNVEESTVGWYGKKAIVTGEHNGNVALKSGELSIAGDQLVGGSFVIDMTTITNEDITEEEDNAKLVGHLMSADFFDVELNPEASLVIKSVEGGNVTADATIKGETKEVTFPVTVTVEEGVATAQAEISLNRTEFGVQYGSKSFFADLVDDYVIDDNIKLTVSLTASK